ncbi:dethiobiotin synthase [Arthrobacter glacialis]|uniref:ATP-dependent dethiobiotin synthetase BioD n=1 Tax=Arthrobacter glacialis TaxID=1664 RepID=A0A2S3ZTS2_ARTGL|nr:dethiobiotin synthase [Arthrobacter glacialis]POH72620.1 dethiobiotin synthase [Arthrobacter glacialis]
MSVTYITGTDTEVGKTLTTAALAVALSAAGAAVAIYKPTQTGVSGSEHGDVDEVSRLSGVHSIHEGIRLGDPMAPRAAAGRANRELPDLTHHVARIAELAASHDHVLVEGAGGLLVELDADSHTLADLAAAATGAALSHFVVVCRSGLGTLNHTALTVEALHRRGFAGPALVIGSWPATPSDVELSNRESLRGTEGTQFLGCLPAGASRLAPRTFRELATQWLHLPHC